MTDQELAAGIAEGKVEALEELVERYHRPILRYLWHAGGSREDAEDLATQTLLKIRADARNFKGLGSLRSWIFQIAYRELLQLRRRQALARLFSSKAEERTETLSDDAIVIAQALARLPLAQRNAFLLTEVEGLTVEEAAAALSVPPGTIKSRCHAARKRLQSLLGSTYGEHHAEPITE